MTEETVSAALARYKKEVSVLKKGFAQERYRVDQLCRSILGSKIVRAVTSVDIASYRDERLQTKNPKTGKCLSPASVRLEMALLSSFFDVALIEWGLCDENPVSKVRKPKIPPGRDRRLTAREDRQILRYAYAHSNRELYSILVLALETAMRQGEILEMTWENINLKSRVAHLPLTKNGTKRDVPLSLKARDALAHIGVKRTGKVFNYTKNGIKSTWRFMMQKLQIKDLHFHDLRHEACSRLFELGTLDVMEIAAISGHKSLAMLKRYTHLKAQRLVRKLEGNKHRGKAAIFENIVPYPAIVEQTEDIFVVRLLDFEGLFADGTDMPSAIKAAQSALLNRILLTMKDSSQDLPAPDQYLLNVNENDLVMIDPLPEAVLVA